MSQVQPKMKKKLESDSARVFESSRNGENVNLKTYINSQTNLHGSEFMQASKTGYEPFRTYF